MDCLAALLAFGVAFATPFDPWEVVDFLEEFGKDIGGMFFGKINAVFRTGDQGYEVFDRVGGFCSEGGREKGIAKSVPYRAVFFS